jgi:CRISPR/Cas system-associated exonuclease Cas4 (RecB family)
MNFCKTQKYIFIKIILVKRRQAAGAIANGATVHAATSFMQQ